ncbi:MAG TPA: VOC family protein [Nitrolancea sp.]|nr:VOC family protein [Nitrolancea sp.]
MALPVNGIGHIALRVTDLQRSQQFYIETVGFTLIRANEQVCFVTVGGGVFALIAGTDQKTPSDRFDPFRVGLDHLALAVAATDLPELKQRLDAANVRNNGIEHDDRSGANSITFYDPDGIAWEFYASAQ